MEVFRGDLIGAKELREQVQGGVRYIDDSPFLATRIKFRNNLRYRPPSRAPYFGYSAYKRVRNLRLKRAISHRRSMRPGDILCVHFVGHVVIRVA